MAIDANSLYDNPILGIAMGLLQAGGPSPTPVGFGQALGAGLQSGAQFQSQGIQRALQQLQLKQALQGQKYFEQFLGGNQPPQNATVATPSPTMQSPIAASSTTIDTPYGKIPNTATVSGSPAPAGPKLPDVMDPTQDPEYQQLQQQAMVAAHFGMDPTPFTNRANARLDLLKNQEVTLTPEQAALLIPGGVAPGTAIKFKPYSGDWSQGGESPIKTIQVMTPAGTMATVPYDTRTGTVRDVGGVLNTKDYSKPLTGSMEQYARDIAAYKRPPPNPSSRFPGAADIIARADYLNKDIGGFDATNYAGKMAAMKSLAAGKDYNQNSAYSTIQTHMDTLKEAFSALDNGDLQSANKLAQWSGKQFGKAAPQNAKVVNDIVVGELAKVLAQGGQVTDSVRNEAAGDLEPYLSKGQFQGAVDYIQQLIAGKMNTSFINAKANHIPEDVFLAHLTPEARAQLIKFQQEHSGQPNSAVNWSDLK